VDVTVAELKSRLSDILRKAAAGKPYVKVGPEKPVRDQLPRIGAFKDHPFRMSDDFDELGPEWDDYAR
jgi:antitoxin (DNA-binding transcriptional repressor) of toxin-antitoxin stability system